LKNDPHEINNLADSPAHQEIIDRMRAAHVRWVRESRDLGLLPEPEIVARAKRYGDRYAVFQQPGSGDLLDQLSEVAMLASDSDPANRDKLKEALNDKDAGVRYWGAIGLGNLSEKASRASNSLRKRLKDDAPVVRVAAARALCRMGEDDTGVPVLIQELGSEHQWVRLHAATVLDNIGDMARPAVPALKEALGDRENKYVVRTVNHALNVLLGTDNKVR